MPDFEDSCCRRYLFRYAFGVFVLLGVVVGLNFLIDPYDVFGSPRIEGFNRYKHGTRENSRIAKVYMVERVKPKSVVVGSSRAEMSFDPRHSYFPQPGFNLSVEGAGIYEVLRMVQHALAVAPVEEVTVSLDFFAFGADRTTGKGFEEHRFAVQSDGSPTWRRYSDHLESLLTYSALQLSWKTLVMAHKKPGYVINEYGFREMWDNNQDVLRKGGFRRAFINNEEINATGYYGPPDRPIRLRNELSGVDTMRWFEALLDACEQRGVRLRLVIFPVHVRMQEVIRARGLWPDYQGWKRTLSDLVEARAGRTKNMIAIELWDFATLAAPNRENIPLPGDVTTSMVYYREASHGTKALGDLVLDCLSTGLQKKTCPDYFGVRLTPLNIGAELQRQTEALSAWRQTHALDVEEIAVTLRHSRIEPR